MKQVYLNYLEENIKIGDLLLIDAKESNHFLSNIFEERDDGSHYIFYSKLPVNNIYLVFLGKVIMPNDMGHEFLKFLYRDKKLVIFTNSVLGKIITITYENLK